MRKNRINFDIVINEPDDGLSFGTDALLLAAYIKHLPKASAAELGAGSGAVSLICAARGKLGYIRAFEIQEEYRDILSMNISENRLGDKVTAEIGDIRDLCGETYDVVFTNPPYMKGMFSAGAPNDSYLKNKARHEENGDIYDFCSAASKALKYGGSFYAVYRPDRITDLFDAMRKSNIEPKRITLVSRDVLHSPSSVLVEGKKGASYSAYITPVLIMYDRDGNETDDMKYIYDNGGFSERFQRP